MVGVPVVIKGLFPMYTMRVLPVIIKDIFSLFTPGFLPVTPRQLLYSKHALEIKIVPSSDTPDTIEFEVCFSCNVYDE